MEKKAEMVVVRAPKIKPVMAQIISTSPLIMHKWSEKAIGELKDNHNKKAKSGKPIRDPEKEYLDSMYKTDSGEFGFPTVAFKAAMIRAAQYADMKMTFLRGAFFIDDQIYCTELNHLVGLVKIDGVPQMREDLVRIGMGVPDFRYRGQFDNWKASLFIRYNESVISIEQIFNLIMIAGFSVGVGEWRPEKNGQFGTFTLVTTGN